MQSKFYRGCFVIFSMFYFTFHISLFKQDIKSMAFYIFLLIAYNLFMRKNQVGNNYTKLFFETCSKLKYSLYLIVGLGMILDNVTSLKIEKNYTLISFFVILISLLEAITGFNSLKENS